jgi:hypothetical protein
MNKIKLYHYSNKDFKGYIKPDFFGDNIYSVNSLRLSGVKRSYFYLELKSREVYLKGSKFCYIAEVEPNRLYDLNKDILGIVKRLRNNQDIYREVKKRGYIGLIGNNGFDCICLFKVVKIKQKILLIKV